MDKFPWVPSLLTIIGWGFVLYNTNRSAKRSEARVFCEKCIDKLEGLITQLSEVKSASTNSTCSTNTDPYAFQKKIDIALNSIETKTKYLQKRTSKHFISTEKIAEFRQLSISEKNAEQMIEMSLDMIEDIEEAFNQRFCSSIENHIIYPLYVTCWVALWMFILYLVGSALTY